MEPLTTPVGAGRLLYVEHFEEICRFCLAGACFENPQSPMFVQDGLYRRYVKGIETESLAEIVYHCLGIKVAANDGLPLNVCTTCETTLVTLYRFRLMCESSVATLEQAKQQMIENASQLDAANDAQDVVDLDVVHYEVQHEAIADPSYEDNEPDDSLEYQNIIEVVEPLESDDAEGWPVDSDDKCEIHSDIENFRFNQTNDNHDESSVSQTIEYGQPTDQSGRNNHQEAPFKPAVQCEICGIVVPGRLRDHMAKHKEQLPFKCPHCPQHYLTQIGLDRHVESHRRHPNAKRPPPLKRARNPQLWRSNVRKTLRQSGQSYISADGETRRSRSVRSSCTPTCSHRCAEYFGGARLQQIHDAFWRLPDKDEFYARFTRRQAPKRQRTKATHSRKAFTYLYYFERTDGKRLQVCQVFFVTTLDISKQRVYRFFRQRLAETDGDAEEYDAIEYTIDNDDEDEEYDQRTCNHELEANNGRD